ISPGGPATANECTNLLPGSVELASRCHGKAQKASVVLHAVPADLAQPFFGLPRDYFNFLADSVDAVYHSGAYVDFIQPYRRLKEANVTGTTTVLRLAAQGRYKPVHFVSMVNVFNGGDSSRIIYESDALSDEQELRTGYDQSKWVAESLVNIARSRGI